MKKLLFAFTAVISLIAYSTSSHADGVVKIYKNGSCTVFQANEVDSVVFASSSDSSNDGEGYHGVPEALVGIWILDSHYPTILAIKLTADETGYYTEYEAGEEPNWNKADRSKVQGNATTIHITNPLVPEFYEDYHYVISEDGKSITLTLIDWKVGTMRLDGTWTRYE